MFIFSLLWVPLFFLLRRAIINEKNSGSLFAAIFGIITAIILFFIHPIIDIQNFQWSLFWFSFVDIVCIPILLPLVIYSIFVLCRFFSERIDFPNFILIWLIPIVLAKGLIGRSETSIESYLLIPVLWTSLAVSIPLFINIIISNFRWWILLLCGLAIIALPIASAVCYWAVFSHRFFLGFPILALLVFLMIFSIVLDFIRSRQDFK
jgi:hypothetical protein